MKNCLILAATPLEIAPLTKAVTSGNIKPSFPEVDLLVGGIGLTATTYALTKYLTLKRPDLVIQVGVGGSFDPALIPGSVVVVKKETIADQSVIELNQLKTLFDLKLLPHNQFPYRKGWLVNNSELLKKSRLKKVPGISVNEITTSKKKVDYYKNAFNPSVESMEGAALHYTCLMENIPFIQFRGISNAIAERNKKKWNMKESIINLNHEVMHFLSLLSNN